MKKNILNSVVGVFIVIIGGFGLIDHASDIHQPYQEADMSPSAKSFLFNYVNGIEEIMSNAYVIEAESLIKIGSFEQSKSNKAYVITEEKAQEISKLIERAENTLTNIKTSPIEAHTNIIEIPHTLISLLVLAAGIMLMSNFKKRLFVFFAVLGTSIIFDSTLMAVGGYNVWGVAVLFNLILCIIVFISNKNWQTDKIEQL